MILLTFCLSIPAYGTAATSAKVPLDSWIYPALDKLSGLGLVQSALQGTRPYTRLEAARQASEAGDHDLLSATASRLIDRLERELRDELTDLGAIEGRVTASYLKPVRRLDLTFIARDGEATSYPGTDARQFSLNTNNFGIDYSDGETGQIRLQGEARLGGFFHLEWEPLLRSSDGDPGLRLLQGRAAVALGPLEISLGRQSLWWGQGRHGSLLLTNNAKPLDMLRVTNPTPVLLPWIFEALGPFRFDLFWSELEEDRHVPEPYFAGLRLSFKPLPWLEFGAARTVTFGGEGRPDVNFSDFITILGGKNLNGEADTSNSIAVIDGRLKIDSLWGMEIYAEYGGEDEADSFLAKHAYLAGVYLPKIEPSERVSLRVEYADLTSDVAGSSPWYRHGIYSSGYVYEGQILGHHVGGGGEDLFAEIGIILPNDLTLNLSFDYEKRDAGLTVAEEHYQPAAAVEWELRPGLALSARYQYDRVDNFDYVPSEERDFHLLQFGCVAAW